MTMATSKREEIVQNKKWKDKFKGWRRGSRKRQETMEMASVIYEEEEVEKNGGEYEISEM